MRYYWIMKAFTLSEQFEKDRNEIYSNLKHVYFEQLEKANDKAYATEHLKRTLLSENSNIPRYSVFFQLLIYSFDHHTKLGEPNPYELAIAFLPHIKEIVQEVILKANRYYSDPLKDPELIHDLYFEGAENENLSILSLIDLDTKLLKAPIKKISALLAYHSAIQQILDEFSIDQEQFVNSSTIDFATGKLDNIITRSQQVLITYYFIQLMGRKTNKNVSKYADALHTFLGLPYSQINNSELYKKLLNPLYYSAPTTTLKNLLVVRSFFEKLDSVQALHLIDADMELIKKSIPE